MARSHSFTVTVKPIVMNRHITHYYMTHPSFMFTILNISQLYVKHSSGASTISTVGQSIMHFRSATTMIHTFQTYSSNKRLQSGVSFYCSPLPHTPVKCVSVLVTWEQLSDVWLDKRSWVACCDSPLKSMLWTHRSLPRLYSIFSVRTIVLWVAVVEAPTGGTVACWAHHLNPRILTMCNPEQHVVSLWKKKKKNSKSVVFTATLSKSTH